MSEDQKNLSEFNLLDEPWIILMRNDGMREKTSILEALDHAQEFKGIAGELPTQDVAVMRLLLAILHTVFSRYDIDGSLKKIDTEEEAVERWSAVWENGYFPMDIIRKYLEEYRYRFYLFDEEYPFYQVAELGEKEKVEKKDYTHYDVSKLNGELAESSNKIRLFQVATDEDKRLMPYDAAARWLLHVNGFDDASAKTKASPPIGWLGKLGVIFAEGETLFETLMLNLILCNENAELDVCENPVWENSVRSGEGTNYNAPDNIAELYTWQSRRLFLERKNGKVSGYRNLGYRAVGGKQSSDAFYEINAFIEPMTAWRKIDDKGSVPQWKPRQLDPSRQMWRELEPILAQPVSDNNSPGIVKWLKMLESYGVLPVRILTLRAVAMKYDSKSMSFTDIITDSLRFCSALISSKSEAWIPTVLNQVDLADKLVYQLGLLAKSIAVASGDSDGQINKQSAREAGYDSLDFPFREWLEKLGEEYVEMSEAADIWWTTARGIILDLGSRMVSEAGIGALIGRSVVENRNTMYYSAAKAHNFFRYKLSSRVVLYRKGGEKDAK
jgi:CRISPR type I-E/ECOLI-associated protein CasA/Cse1